MQDKVLMHRNEMKDEARLFLDSLQSTTDILKQSVSAVNDALESSSAAELINKKQSFTTDLNSKLIVDTSAFQLKAQPDLQFKGKK